MAKANHATTGGVVRHQRLGPQLVARAHDALLASTGRAGDVSGTLRGQSGSGRYEPAEQAPVMHPSSRDLVHLLAILSVTLCLVPAGAHFFEMFNKLSLSPAEYMTVQRIYAGWALFGFAVLAALALTLAHAIMTWRHSSARWLSLMAFLSIVATQAIFWTFTYPVNALTRQWTVLPPDLVAARLQWEYSHAVNAALTLLALVWITAAALADCRASRK